MQKSNAAPLTRRRLLRRLGLGATTLVVGTPAYATLIEPFHPVVERVTIPIRNLPGAFDGYRIVQLSDLHVQPWFPAARLAPAIALTQAEHPDLIVLTGDYINDDAPDPEMHLRDCIQALAVLPATAPVYAIFGNHDYPAPPNDPSPIPWIAAGIRPLSNEITPLRRGNATVSLVGLRSFIQRPVTPADLLNTTPPNSVRLVLWHEPDRAAECAAAGAALQLSGHTHGGQVVLPFIGPPELPAGGKKYASGLFHVANMPLYVTRGIGLLTPRVRLNCPPEVTVITLRRG